MQRRSLLVSAGALLAAPALAQETFKVAELWTWKQQALAESERDPSWAKGSAISLETGFD